MKPSGSGEERLKDKLKRTPSFGCLIEYQVEDMDGKDLHGKSRTARNVTSASSCARICFQVNTPLLFSFTLFAYSTFS